MQNSTVFHETLVKLWQEILDHTQFNVNDIFFAVGGGSLQKIRLSLAVMREYPELDIQSHVFMECETIAEQANYLATLSGVEVTPDDQLEEEPVDSFPLSIYQESIWLSEQRAQSHLATYHMPYALIIEGSIQPQRLHQAISQVVSQHGAFYTRFEMEKGMPVQVVGAEPVWSWTEHSLDIPYSNAASAIEEICDQFINRPFDIEKGPLLRVELVPLISGEWLLFVDMHHLLSDEWSMHLLVEQICQAYNGNAQWHEAPNLYAYGQFSAHQRTDAVLQSSPEFSFWQEKLKTFKLAQSLPSLGRGDAVDMKREVMTVCGEELDNLGDFAKQINGTMNAIVMASLAISLTLGTRMSQIRFGSPVASRPKASLGDMVGYFLNTLVQTVPIQRNMTMRAVVEEVIAELNRVLPYSHVPYSILKEEVGTALEQELFQCRYLFSEDLSSRVQLNGCNITPVSLKRRGQKYPLLISAQIIGSKLNIAFDYNAAIYPDSQIQVWRDNCAAIFKAFIEQPDINLLTFAKERMSQLRQSRGPGLSSGTVNVERRTVTADLPARANISLSSFKRRTVASASDTATLGKSLLGITVEQAARQQDLLLWLKERKAHFKHIVSHQGAVLFRGFNALTPEEFEQLLTLWGGEAPVPYLNRSTPRTQVHRNIYTSTEYPAEQTIPQHNEGAYSSSWPLQLALMCQTEPKVGGQTPLADSRKVFNELPAELREKFIRLGVKYIRNYSEVGLSWQETFQTSCKKDVERYCKENGIHTQWLENGRLRTEQIGPAALQHPVTKEWCWFNQAHLFHISNLDAQTLLAMKQLYPQGDYPRTACFGDGQEFEAHELDIIRDLYRKHQVKFDWKKNDVVILDNILFSHGRAPYSGERKILVGMIGKMKAGFEKPEEVLSALKEKCLERL
ncbi:condensation domain-containing protein [Pseudoalteromonas piscicida]|uniref:condensation domain-containing protein n=1 Tax=Pseudoalteromonas piscicida TaxID=43662 RepID=UPI0030B402FE